MRSISRLALFVTLLGAVLVGTGLSAYANPSMPGQPYAPPPVLAQGAPPQAPPGEAPRATVAAIMQEAGQALLWDGVRNEYVVVRAGGVFQDFHVSAISAEQVVLSRGNQHFVLTRAAEAPDLTRRSHASASVGGQPAQSAQGQYNAQAGLADPYAAAARPQPLAGIVPFAAQAPVDPYAPAPGTPYAPAPATPYAPAPATPYAPAPATPYAPAGQAPLFFSPDELPPGPGPMDPYAAPMAPAPVAPSLPSSLLESRVASMPRANTPPPRGTKASAPAAAVAGNDTARANARPQPAAKSQGEATAPRDEQHSLSRKEFDAAISDFDALGRDIQVAQTADGVRVDEVAAGSLAYRMGVRAGDVVLDVDGKKLRSMNDAATIYARLMDAEKFAVKVRRGTGTMTLRYRFTR